MIEFTLRNVIIQVKKKYRMADRSASQSMRDNNRTDFLKR